MQPSKHDKTLEILFGVLKDEYARDRDRKNSVEARAGVFMSVAFVALSFIIPRISFSDELNDARKDAFKQGICWGVRKVYEFR